MAFDTAVTVCLTAIVSDSGNSRNHVSKSCASVHTCLQLLKARSTASNRKLNEKIIYLINLAIQTGLLTTTLASFSLFPGPGQFA